MPEIQTTTDPATQLASHKIVLLNVSTKAEKPAKYIGARPDIFDFVRVTPDGRSVAYVVVENGVSNVWSQSIDGSKGHWLTNFTADQNTTLQFSPDGKYLGIGRSHVISNLVLPRDSNTPLISCVVSSSRPRQRFTFAFSQRYRPAPPRPLIPGLHSSPRLDLPIP